MSGSLAQRLGRWDQGTDRPPSCAVPDRTWADQRLQPPKRRKVRRAYWGRIASPFDAPVPVNAAGRVYGEPALPRSIWRPLPRETKRAGFRFRRHWARRPRAGLWSPVAVPLWEHATRKKGPTIDSRWYGCPEPAEFTDPGQSARSNCRTREDASARAGPSHTVATSGDRRSRPHAPSWISRLGHWARSRRSPTESVWAHVRVRTMKHMRGLPLISSRWPRSMPGQHTWQAR